MQVFVPLTPLPTNSPPSLRECGHAFCGTCLRMKFAIELKPRLLDIPLLAQYGRPEFNCHDIPASRAHLQTIVDGINSNTSIDAVVPEQVFTYTCPSCRGTVTKPPIVPFKLSFLLASVHKAIKGRLSCSPEYDVGEQPKMGLDYFDGLFLE